MSESDMLSRHRRDFTAFINIFRGAVAVLFGVAIPLGVNLYVKPIARQDNVIIILASWAAGLGTEILFELIIRSRESEFRSDILKNTISKSQADWIGATEFDQLLIEMRKSYQEMTADLRADPDLFSEYYKSRLRGLNRQLGMSANSQLLPVNIRHFDTTDILMSCLLDGHNDDFLAVHFLAANDYVQNVPHARRYLTRSEEKILNGELKQVRRLFIVDDGREAEQLRDSFSVAFLGFHETSQKFDYRIIQSSTYRAFLSDADPDNPLAEDFGVYGRLYVYETQVASAQAIQGHFSSDPDRIQTYRRHFERCWDYGRIYSEFVDEPLPNVPRARDVFDPFFQRRYHIVSLAAASAANAEAPNAGQIGFSTINASLADLTELDVDRISQAILEILGSVRVCSMATVTPVGSSHIWTSFFSYTVSPFRIQVITPPVTEHAANIERNGDVAVAVHALDQRWADPKTGLQIFGRARRVNELTDATPRKTYLARFPELSIGLARWPTLNGTGSHFYEVAIQRVKIVDEARFGEDAWVDAEVQL
jgi:uncharacterized protein YhbP (UPF0306 family)